MKQMRVVVTIGCVLAAVIPAAASAAGDPLGQAKADLAKLTTDAATAGSAVSADAKGSDLAQLKRDAKAGQATLESDWKLLLVDVTAARKAGADKAQLRSLLQAARTQVKAFRSVVRSAFRQARQTAKQNKGSNGSKGASKGKPSGQGSDEDGSGG
jgi:hypothetical protein